MAKKSVATTTVTLTPDPANANKGTTRGAALIRESLDVCGPGRSIVTDKHGTIIGGNKTFAAATDLGIPIEQIQTTGTELVVVQRTDLDLAGDDEARQLAYYDNRTQQVDLAWDVPQVQDDLLAKVPLTEVFFPDELRDVLGLQTPETLPATDVGAMPTEDEIATPKPAGTFVLKFETAAQRDRWRQFMARLKTRYPDASTGGERLWLHLTRVS